MRPPLPLSEFYAKKRKFHFNEVSKHEEMLVEGSRGYILIDEVVVGSSDNSGWIFLGELPPLRRTRQFFSNQSSLMRRQIPRRGVPAAAQDCFILDALVSLKNFIQNPNEKKFTETAVAMRKEL